MDWYVIKRCSNSVMSGQIQDIKFGLQEHSQKVHFILFTQFVSIYQRVPISCCSSLQLWWYSKFSVLENFLHTHHWKTLSVLVLLLLLCLGLKYAKPETDFYRLWVEGMLSARFYSNLNFYSVLLKNCIYFIRSSSKYFFRSCLCFKLLCRFRCHLYVRSTTV